MARRRRGARLVEQLLNAQARGRALYNEADKLLERLMKVIEPGDEIDLGDGRVAKLVDQFANGRLVVWHSSGCKRYKVDVSTAAK